MGHKHQVNMISDFTRKHQINCFWLKILTSEFDRKKKHVCVRRAN